MAVNKDYHSVVEQKSILVAELDNIQHYKKSLTMNSSYFSNVLLEHNFWLILHYY